MSYVLGSKIVPSRPKEHARYSVRELLILGLTLPIRFCPISKFGPEALGLEIISLERLHESLKQYEREQLRQWQLAQIDAKKRMIEAVITRSLGARDKDKHSIGSSSAMQDIEGDGEGDKTLSYEIVTAANDHKTMPRVDSVVSSYASSDNQYPRQDTLHFQIPPSHTGAPVNINIGLSLDYSSVPHGAKNPTQRPQVITTANSQHWSAHPTPPSANLSKYLNDAPASKPTRTSPTEPQPEPQAQAHTPPAQHTTPDIQPKQHGGDTPNSMAVERATEPSLHSYSPTSSIRAPSEIDYEPASESMVMDAMSASHSDYMASSQFTFAGPSTPMAESVVTLIPVESPAETLVATPRKEPEEREEEFVVVPSVVVEASVRDIGTSAAAPAESGANASGSESMSIGTGAGASSSGSATGTGSASSSVGVALGKALLGKGKIDPKAQDDFIAFMMGKR